MGKTKKMFAVITDKGEICGNLIRSTRPECVDAHEAMWHSPWYKWREAGYRIKRVTVKMGK